MGHLKAFFNMYSMDDIKAINTDEYGEMNKYAIGDVVYWYGNGELVIGYGDDEITCYEVNNVWSFGELVEY